MSDTGLVKFQLGENDDPWVFQVIRVNDDGTQDARAFREICVGDCVRLSDKPGHFIVRDTRQWAGAHGTRPYLVCEPIPTKAP